MIANMTSTAGSYAILSNIAEMTTSNSNKNLVPYMTLINYIPVSCIMNATRKCTSRLSYWSRFDISIGPLSKWSFLTQSRSYMEISFFFSWKGIVEAWWLVYREDMLATCFFGSFKWWNRPREKDDKTFFTVRIIGWFLGTGFYILQSKCQHSKQKCNSLFETLQCRHKKARSRWLTTKLVMYTSYRVVLVPEETAPGGCGYGTK